MQVLPLHGLPALSTGDDLAGLILAAADLRAGDIVVVASKALSKVQGRLVDLESVEPSPQARTLAEEVGKDPRMVEWILRDSLAISRSAPGVLIVRHRLGHVCANAGLDRSNARGRVVRLPEDPDGWASEMRRRASHEVAVVVSDTVGRAFRRGAMGTAIGLAGLPPLVDLRGRTDLDGRAIEHSEVPVADIAAAAADLVMGQTDEGVPAAVVRGVSWTPSGEACGASALLRPPQRDLYV